MYQARNKASFLRILALIAVTFCVSCKSNTEQAAGLVEQGQAQEQAGDQTAALKSFRDALGLDSENIDARRALAALLFQQDDFVAARSEYLAIRERLPSDLETNLSLTEIALAQYDTASAETFLEVPKKTDAASARTRAAIVALEFYKADVAGDEAGRQNAVNDAKAILQEAPDSFAAHRIVIQFLMHGDDPEAALPDIDAELKQRPKSLELNMMKLNVLTKREDSSAGSDQLKAMYRDFPDNADIQSWLADWYLAAGAPDETVAFLRDLAARHGEDLGEHARIAAYVVDHYTAADAAAELERLRQAYPNGSVSDIYLAREAVVRFDIGHKDRGIKMLRDLLAREPAPADPVVPLTSLARMLYETGQGDEAKRLADKAISLGTGSVPAQILRADWSMQEKDYHGAATLLLQALSAAPENPEVLMRLGRAYDADGSPQLANAALANAVRASGYGAQESIAFVQFLLRDDKRSVAETVVQAALKAHPDDPDLLTLATQENFTLPAP